MGEGWGAALEAVLALGDPTRLLLVLGGVVLGLVIGAIPGLGGIVALSLLLPFTFHMDPMTALAMLIGMHAAIATSDSIPAVLLGIPGTVGSAATVVDGHPMAQRGESGRALGAAFTASLLGGLAGVAALTALLPVLRPMMLSFGTPEMLAICLLGLSLAAALSGGHLLRGLAAACLGLALSLIGEDFQSGTLRWTFGTFYLWDGLPLVPLVLGLFAVPELAEVARRRRLPDLPTGSFAAGRWQGVRDVLTNPRIVLRSSGIGAVLGAMPGVGSSVIDWVSYGATARRPVPDARFGQGDVRGVIASEAANNAKEGGALVPTLAFGVPGSAGMAILLGAFLYHGLVPGPEMLGRHLDLTYAMIVSVALANVVGAAVCIALVPWLARIARVPSGVLVPLVMGLVLLAAFQGSLHWGDLVVLLVSGAVGILMRQFGWPRPPLIMGFVLGVMVERYFATSMSVYGLDFLWRPGVMILLALMIWSLATAAWKVRHPLIRARPQFGPLLRPDVHTLFCLIIAAFFAAMLWSVRDWQPAAALMPRLVALSGLVLVVLHVFRRAWVPDLDAGSALDALSDGRAGQQVQAGLRGGVVFWGWMLALGGLAVALGPLPALLPWIAIYAWLGFGLSPLRAAALAVLGWLAAYGLFELVVEARFPRPPWI